MSEIDEGFILSNKFRKAILIELASGEKKIKRIAKKHHLIERMVERAMKELEEEKIAREENGNYFLTDRGKKVLADLKAKEAI